MGYMKDIAIRIEDLINNINDDLQYSNMAYKVVFIQGLIDQLERERKELVDKIFKENKEED